MLTCVKGNIFEAGTEAIVNPVNCIGNMSGGLAKEFKKQFPDNYKFYKSACKLGQIDIGNLLIYKLPSELKQLREEIYFLEPPADLKYIVNFPTMITPRLPSDYEYIKQGLEDLICYIMYKDIKSIAIPALGCGIGGLEWDKVKMILEQYLTRLINKKNVKILIYEPL